MVGGGWLGWLVGGSASNFPKNRHLRFEKICKQKGLQQMVFLIHI